MANQTGMSMVLQDQAGQISNASQGKVTGVGITSALTGSLTITGVTNTDGTPASWIINSGSSGAFTPPGSTRFGGSLSYAFSSASDVAKAFVAWQ